MNLEQFTKLAEKYDYLPVFEKITADLFTPVIAYLKLRQQGKQSFLLETVEGKESLGRYSFIGIDPHKIISNKGMSLSIKDIQGIATTEKNIFDYLKEELHTKNHPALDELPSFTGGTVGYIAYENIALIEPILKFEASPDDINDSILGVYETILAFDHYKHQLIIITNVSVNTDSNLTELYSNAKLKIKELRKQLAEPLHFQSDFTFDRDVKESLSDEVFCKLVEASKENIIEGDVFQIVLSKRFTAGYKGDLFNVYRALRIINPSPYMYFLEFETGLTIIGTSPENLVKVKDGIVEVMPIAGTRKRGATPEEDKELETDLMNDPKEIAEHVMLVDLGRNDLGRVSEYGSVELTEKMKIHRFSHVMHIVSKVQGKLRKDKDCIDALKSCFPAGTVTGAPKIRAMELISSYEKLNRNVYAGAVGYIDFSGNLDVCIAIRTLFAKDSLIHWQAGAGLVADSQPKLEAKEIRNKSAVLRNALEHAETIDEDISS
jgi:anthranilate synthase component 1